MVRFRIPQALASATGVKELRRSLHSTGAKEARLRCAHATIWFRITVERLEKMTEARIERSEA